MAHSTLIYDGNCFFCTKCAEWFARRSDGAIRHSQSFSDSELDELNLSRDDVEIQAWWIDGVEKFGGAYAVGHALLTTRYSYFGRLLLSRPVLPISRRIYKFVSSHRSWFSRLIRYFS